MEAAIDLEAGKFASAERLLGVAETAAQNNGKTGLNSLVSQWFARLATAKGHEAAASSYLTEARFAFPAPSPTVRAGFAVEELRQAIVFVARAGNRTSFRAPRPRRDPTAASPPRHRPRKPCHRRTRYSPPSRLP